MLHSSYHEPATLPTNLSTKKMKTNMLFLRFKSFVERPVGNSHRQGWLHWQLWVYEKTRKLILSAKLQVFHCPKQ